MTEEEKKKIEEAVSIILRGIDIESSALILEKAVMDNYIIVSGRVNILRVATRQILNFIEEYKNKGYLDVVREKVKANEEVTKLQKENEEKDKKLKKFEDECRKFKAFCKKIRKSEKHDVDLFNQGQEHKCNQFLNLISEEPHWDYEGKYFDETDKEIEKLVKEKG